MDRPDWSVLRSMVDDLTKARRGLGDAHRRLLAVRGEARSDDKLIRAVVGPRGQLVDLELDPRLFRNPDSKTLAAAIVATVRSAVENSQQQARDLRDELLPPDMRTFVNSGSDGPDLMAVQDADLGDRNA